MVIPTTLQFSFLTSDFKFRKAGDYSYYYHFKEQLTFLKVNQCLWTTWLFPIFHFIPRQDIRARKTQLNMELSIWRHGTRPETRTTSPTDRQKGQFVQQERLSSIPLTISKVRTKGHRTSEHLQNLLTSKALLWEIMI